MRAAILEGEDLAPLGPRENDRIARERRDVRPPRIDVPRSRQRIPEVRMKSDPAEVRFVALSLLRLHPSSPPLPREYTGPPRWQDARKQAPRVQIAHEARPLLRGPPAWRWGAWDPIHRAGRGVGVPAGSERQRIHDGPAIAKGALDDTGSFWGCMA